MADVRSTVPAEEVARLRYSPLPETASIFPYPLVDSLCSRCLLLLVTLLCRGLSILPGFLGNLRQLVSQADPRLLWRKGKRCRESQPDGVTLPVRVGGCLAQHWRHWQAVGAETWVVTVLRDGYRVPFKDSSPPLSRTPVSFPTYRAGSPRAQALRQEVEAMLAKGALEIVRDPGPGFYSRLCLVEKATGDP